MIPDRIKIDEEYYLAAGPTDADLDSLVLYMNDIGIYNGTLKVPYPYTKSDAESYLENFKKRNKEFGRPMNWQIRDKEDHLIGSISLHNQYGVGSHKDEIGYWLGRPFWNKGIMSRTLIAFSKLVFENYGIVRLEVTIFDYNISSQRTVEKSGFNYEGTLKKAYFKDGKYIDAKLYALVK